MADVLLTSYHTGANNGDTSPTDEVTLVFSKLQLSYAAQKADGSLDTPVVVVLDVSNNKAG
jgi:type VI secretion system secreted protein Hcp